jgi:hypothetical protein
MVYITQRHWVFGLCPSSGFFLNNNEKTQRFGNWICFRPQSLDFLSMPEVEYQSALTLPDHYADLANRDAGQYVWSSSIPQFATKDDRRTHLAGSEWSLKVRFREYAGDVLGFKNEGKY